MLRITTAEVLAAFTDWGSQQKTPINIVSDYMEQLSSQSVHCAFLPVPLWQMEGIHENFHWGSKETWKEIIRDQQLLTNCYFTWVSDSKCFQIQADSQGFS